MNPILSSFSNIVNQWKQQHSESPKDPVDRSKYNFGQENVKKSYGCNPSNHVPKVVTNPQNSNFQYLHSETLSANDMTYCEPCDKEMTRAAFAAHIKTHEKCTVANCSFTATKKIVHAHYLSAHGLYSGSGYKEINIEGQVFNVLLGSDPNEIEQWRVERRKRFPTTHSVSNRLNAIKKLEDSGGIFDRDYNSLEGEHTISKLDGETESNLNRRNSKLCKFYLRGKCNAGENCRFNHDSKREKCPRFNQGKCAKGGNCQYSHEGEINVEESSSRPGKRKFGLFLPDPLSGGKKGSLLQYLLNDAILEEENMMLQCIRFIVQTNYLDNHSVNC